MNLLIIEDDRDIATYFERIAKMVPKMKVFVAHDADEIEQALKAIEFDCILCDVQLIGTTGPEELIRNKYFVGDAIVNIVSSLDDLEQYKTNLMDHGMRVGACLRKGLGPKDLITFLKGYCQ
jgi:DNA-binding response OmpR family regulator